MTFVDLAFPVQGSTVAADHGYALYGAISHVQSQLHGARWLAVHPLSGKPLDDGQLMLGPRAQLRLRLPVERIPDVLCLAGVALDVAGSTLRLGAPSVYALEPADSLDARLVVVKLTHVPKKKNKALGREAMDRDGLAAGYMAELKRQLAKLEITSIPDLRGRGRIQVAGKRIVGYSVRVSGLDPQQSIRLQENGLGGKHAMGCGIFRPTRGDRAGG